MAESANTLPEAVIETLARTMHEDYLRNQRERGGTPDSNPSIVLWDELPETLKESNRDQARHIGVKLAATGCEIERLSGRDAEPFSFSAEEVERLAELEHERWWRQREAAGWTPAPHKDAERRQSPYLVPYEELPEEIREYDRDTVRGMPGFLAAAGFRIVRSKRATSD